LTRIKTVIGLVMQSGKATWIKSIQLLQPLNLKK